MTQNSQSSLLLEIGTEDLPARFIRPALQQLGENTEKILRENYISCAGTRVFGTPRRLAVIAEGLPQMQEDRTKEVWGPSKKAAFDANGNPTKAAAGFAQSQGVSVESLVVKKKDKGEYLVAIIEEKGVGVRDVLPELLRKIVLSIHLPKAMRWGDNDVKFVRPIRWLLSLFDKEVINFDIDGIQSSNLTRGHRFLSPAAFQIREILSYRKLLGNNCVIVDTEERKKLIRDKITKLLVSYGESPLLDEGLLDTVVNLVEYPVPVVAAFSEEYLKLPKELLITVMKDHQKYFAVQNSEGGLTNHFVVVSNTSEDNAETVRTGAERVIRARFEDARFYYEEDVKKPLAERIEELRKVTFQEDLGSMYDKTERVTSIAGFLAERLLPGSKDKLMRAARLAKTDLITGVVREFPELQGTMGNYYAVHDGEGSEVGDAIEEHYLPKHSGGALPKSDAGALLSLADKMDNIAAFFSIGLIPTGSEDPFALRRQSLGVIAILLEKGYEITLRELSEKALSNLKGMETPREIQAKILQFLGARLENVLGDRRLEPDIVQAVISLAADTHLKKITERLEALRAFKNTEECEGFLAAVKRVNNIIQKAEAAGFREELLVEDPEKKLYERFSEVRVETERLVSAQRYQEAIDLLATLTLPVNTFFDNVLVMDKREEIKINRLSMLSEIWRTVSSVADFSKLSVS
ncbi:MAG TPA: glycine--tRNA ligase subunit beta [Thermodesulfovibrionales bacterium]|nr:glycine--tRNA ligase subunit beta [Thermodesulfovibrionales bacterium]